nr:kunitz-type elastase inhibitor BrEI-like [Ipomoea trifida]
MNQINSCHELDLNQRTTSPFILIVTLKKKEEKEWGVGGLSTLKMPRLQYPLNVAFDWADPSDPCAKENVWKLNDEAAIVTGGVIGKEDDLDNWFRIQNNINGRGYLFNWWPSLCLGCRIGYFRIGTVGDGYQLGINYRDEALYPFEFVKAE